MNRADLRYSLIRFAGHVVHSTDRQAPSAEDRAWVHAEIDRLLDDPLHAREVVREYGRQEA